MHHPSYIDFFEQVLADTTDPHVMSRPSTRSSSPRTSGTATCTAPSYAYHGVHPFYMWYWGAHGMQHCGRVIIVGGDPPAVRRLGFTPASTMDDALEMATDVVGRSPDHHPPAHPAAAARGREVGRRRWRPRTVPPRRSRLAAPPAEPAQRRRTRRPSRCATSASRTGAPTVPTRRRGARRSRRRSAPTTTPTGPARPLGPRRPRVHHRRPAAAGRAGARRPRDPRPRPPRRPRRRAREATPPPVIFAPEPPQPPRHAR